MKRLLCNRKQVTIAINHNTCWNTFESHKKKLNKLLDIMVVIFLWDSHHLHLAYCILYPMIIVLLCSVLSAFLFLCWYILHIAFLSMSKIYHI